MPAYVIVDVDIVDPAAYERYKPLAQESIARHGGRYLARGGRTHVLEGERVPRRLVVLEFPSLEAARAWHASEDYAPAKAMRAANARTEMIVVEGLDRPI
jgi:uncharacterized protein (DUF1330 family)